MNDDLFAEVAARAQRLRARVMGLLMLAAVGLGGVFGYSALLIQFALLDEAYSSVVAIAVATPLAAVIKYGPYAIGRVLFARSRAWIPELCLRYRVTADDVESVLSVFMPAR
jgi:hypothetical protein